MTKGNTAVAIAGLLVLSVITGILQSSASSYTKITSQAEMSEIIGGSGACGCTKEITCPTTAGCSKGQATGFKCTTTIGCKNDVDGCNDDSVPPKCAELTCA